MTINELKSTFEKEIEGAIERIPADVDLYRRTEAKSKLLYKDDRDFVQGMVYSRILCISICNYRQTIRRELTEDDSEYEVILSMINNRIPEIRQTIDRSSRAQSV